MHVLAGAPTAAPAAAVTRFTPCAGESTQTAKFRRNLGRSEPIWSLNTDDWSGCAHVAGTLSDSEEEEAVGTHATVVSSDTGEHNAGYQSGVGVLRRSAHVQGQMALKDAFNQELHGSRANGGRGLLGRRRPNCFSGPLTRSGAGPRCSAVAEWFSRGSRRRQPSLMSPEVAPSPRRGSGWRK